MPTTCPVCKQKLPHKFQMYKVDKIHALHSMIDELIAGHVPVGDPTFTAALTAAGQDRERNNKT